MKRINITQLAAVAAVAGTLGAPAALAGDEIRKPPAPQAKAATGAPKVIFVNATPEQRARAQQADAAAASVMRAYLDGAGNLRAPTVDDLTAEAAAARAPAAGRAGARTALAAAATPQVVSAHGGNRIDVDESAMSYSVATVQPDGQVKQDCVTGVAAATDAVKSPVNLEVDRHEK